MTDHARCRRRRMARAVMAVSMFGVSMAAAQGVAAQPAASAQSKTPVFDVATIKPNNTFSGSMDSNTNLDTFSAKNLSLKYLLQRAYGINQSLISGLPGWAESAHYDIVAKVVDVDVATMRNLTREQRQAMLQQLLADRFQLRCHIEQKTLPVFELIVANGGIRFTQSPATEGDPRKNQSISIRNTEMTARNASMESLATTLTDQVGRKVIDKTGLTGAYNLHLKWEREEEGPSKDPGDASAPSIFTALQQQLGLKLQSAKDPVDTLVVDSIETPSEN